VELSVYYAYKATNRGPLTFSRKELLQDIISCQYTVIAIASFTIVRESSEHWCECKAARATEETAALKRKGPMKMKSPGLTPAMGLGEGGNAETQQLLCLSGRVAQHVTGGVGRY
jgi:hypothetical protein